MGNRLLAVRDLAVQFRDSDGGATTVVEEASFELSAGEALGVLGESGSGKTTLALALMGLVPSGGCVTRGEVIFGDGAEGGRDLLRMKEKELTAVRGDDISMVFQEPGISLSPCLRVGNQVADVVQAHRNWSRRRCRQLALQGLERVGFERPGEMYAAYPHQLSGGQQQRVVIAQALACEPAILIADEPTAALDATTQARIVTLLREMKQTRDLSLMFISHDPALLTSLADRLLVMYAGQIVEMASCDQLVQTASHPYARELLRCARLPSPVDRSASDVGTEAGRSSRLPVIPGTAPDPARWPSGCRFEPRCPDRVDECRERQPPLLKSTNTGSVRCWVHGT